MSSLAMQAGIPPDIRRRDALTPVSIPTEQLWLGNDGPWSPFLIGFGSPAQFVRVLVSTSSPQPYVVLPQGCIASDSSDCPSARGGFFYSNRSTTWKDVGIYSLQAQTNLGINAAGDFFFDNITLGIQGTGVPPSLGRQTIAGVIDKDFFLGSLGLRPVPTNFSNFDNPIPSLMQNLKTGLNIPSLSYGYTAGSYQMSKVNKYGHGSLTIGGYDRSRFIDSKSLFQFADDTSRDLVVGLIGITTENGQRSLLPNPILTFLDSAVSHIWLPLEACQRFESAFNLTYDNNLGLYIVNDTTHQALLAANPTVSFTLNNNISITTTSTSVTIDLPYSAFDLQLTSNWPNNRSNSDYYFPLRRATNDTQYTLGRTFFQHAYVIADYERSIFSVHQATFPSGTGSQDLQTIYTTDSNPQPKLQSGAIAGIVVAAVVAVLIILAAVYWRYRQNRKQTRVPIALNESELDALEEKPKRNLELEGSVSPKRNLELEGSVSPMSELHSKSPQTVRELAGDVAAREMYAQPSDRRHLMHELPG